MTQPCHTPKYDVCSFVRISKLPAQTIVVDAAETAHRTEWLLRILVADDHTAVRKGVCALLRSRNDLEVCGEAQNGQEAIEKTRQLEPDLIILDIAMPLLDGFSAVREIRKFMPDVSILVLSMHRGKKAIQEAKLLGAQGFVSKSELAGTLLNAVDVIARKQTFFEGDEV
jgi:DNA-binding NarL/FixJ family response regulator